MVTVPTSISFQYTHDYGTYSRTDGIVVPIGLSIGGRSVPELLAKLDTGAEDCIFQREYGEQWGLEIESGLPKRFGSAAGGFDAFGHAVDIDCFGFSIQSTVYFARDYNFYRNVLGRNGWLQRFRIAIIDYDSILHISYYDHN